MSHDNIGPRERQLRELRERKAAKLQQAKTTKVKPAVRKPQKRGRRG